MKKQSLILIVLPLLALASCRENSSSPISNSNSAPHISSSSSEPQVSSNSSSSSSNSSSSSVPDIQTDEEKINAVIDALKSVSNSSSYTVNYEEDDGTSLGTTLKLTDIYTPNYISIGYMNGGYLTLPSYDSSLGDTMVYDFKYDTAGNVVLGKAVTYYDNNDKLQTVSSCVSMDYMKLFTQNPTYAITPSMFKVANNVITSENDELLYVLSHEMGYSPETTDYIITSARFEIDDQGQLTFYLYNQIDTDSTAEELLIKATFADLNNTKNQKLEDYVKNYKLPESSLDTATYQKLIADTVSFDTTIRYRSESGFVDFGEVSVSSYYDEENTKNNKMAYHIYDSVNHEEYSYILTVGENNQAIDHYIDGTNNPATQVFNKNGYYWGNGIFSIQEEVDNNFLSSDDKSYQYFGINIDRLYESITALSVLTDLNIKSVDSLQLVKGDNGTITLEGEITAFYYNADGEPVDLSVNTISTLNENKTITIPTSYEENSDSETLKTAFASIKNQESYIATAYATKADGTAATSLPVNTYYLKKDEYFIMNTTDRDNYVNTITGYKVIGDELIPFTVDKQGEVTQSGDPITDKTLGEVIPFNLSSNIFTKDKESNLTYRVKDNVKHENEVMIGGPTLSAMLDSSLSIKLDDLGRLDKVNYSYVYRGLLAGDEEMTFEYSSEQALPDFIDADSFEKLDGNEQVLNSWADENNKNIYKAFVANFGATIADEIPYLYDKDVSNTWNLGVSYDGTGDLCVYSNSPVLDAFKEKYISYLTELGYKQTTIKDRTYYANDTICIRFGEVIDETQDYSDYIFFNVIS